MPVGDVIDGIKSPQLEWGNLKHGYRSVALQEHGFPSKRTEDVSTAARSIVSAMSVLGFFRVMRLAGCQTNDAIPEHPVHS